MNTYVSETYFTHNLFLIKQIAVVSVSGGGRSAEALGLLDQGGQVELGALEIPRNFLNPKVIR